MNDAPATLNERLKPSRESPRGAFVATVKENRALCTAHYRLTLALPHFPPSAPGQFIQLDCRDPHADPDHSPQTPRTFDWPPQGPRPTLDDPDFAAPLAYLRRPFSIADCRYLPDGSAELDVIHRVVGRGTQLLAGLHTGERLSLLGPLGNGFPMPQDLQLACLIGGGVGIPPMLYLAKALAARGCHMVAVLGAQRRDLLPVTLIPPPHAPETSTAGTPVMNVQELLPHQCPAIITTDDGSLGMKGFVTDALRRFLQARRNGPGLAGVVAYCCGPTPMMKATARVAADFGVTCCVSLEQPMACGMGTCQSCIIKFRPHTAPAEVDWKYRLTCTDGPVFDSRDILW
jgi:dihydroorotate dehydrogenase electron transfer subunit